MESGHHSELLKLAVRVLALQQHKWGRANLVTMGLMVKMSALKTLYSGQFSLSTQLIQPNYLVKSLPMQNYNFFRNLHP